MTEVKLNYFYSVSKNYNKKKGSKKKFLKDSSSFNKGEKIEFNTSITAAQFVTGATLKYQVEYIYKFDDT